MMMASVRYLMVSSRHVFINVPVKHHAMYNMAALNLCTGCQQKLCLQPPESISHKHRRYSVRTKIPDEYRDVKFTTFYQFPYIRFTRLLARMKLYQTGFTVLGIPGMYYMYVNGLADLLSFQAMVGVASFAGVMLYVMGNFLRRVIGLMALNETEDIVRISRLTFWGNRSDHYVPVTDIEPIGDYAMNPTDAYIELKRYSNEHMFYMSLKYGGIRDKERFQTVFGSI